MNRADYVIAYRQARNLAKQTYTLMEPFRRAAIWAGRSGLLSPRERIALLLNEAGKVRRLNGIRSVSYVRENLRDARRIRLETPALRARLSL